MYCYKNCKYIIKLFLVFYVFKKSLNNKMDDQLFLTDNVYTRTIL